MFNGKPQALPANFAYACGSPLNENDQYTMKSTPVASTIRLTKCDKSWAATTISCRNGTGQEFNFNQKPSDIEKRDRLLHTMRLCKPFGTF
jgi:hypothetical protein